MKRSPPETAGFSLVELTLALGVAALCLLVMLGMLPASFKNSTESIQQTMPPIISQNLFVSAADVDFPGII